MIRIRCASCSETGARRHNEDQVRHGSARAGHYAILADGAGGHSRGAEAALRAVDCIERLLLDDAMAYSPANLGQAVRLAHSELVHHQDSERLEARMHATIVVLWIDAAAEHAIWAHVGDSRLYRVRQGRTDIVTVDDSVVQQLVQSGVISAAQSRSHPQKNQLLAALGMSGEVDPHVVARPVALLEGDAYLLCSDGWWDGFEPATLALTLEHALSPQDWIDAMRERIVARQLPRQDNYSAIALWAGDPGEVTQPGVDDTRPNAAVGP
ncbi:MAG: serine/threonine-protein phosphatase [Burkholderiales bacterium]|nr:serine/threonine-protein phosphatase [Burkholderiales bacterium]MDE1929151.1 serine/threonine-protein phosphatase [Burkholderiales bacterium]MDE2159559.1 serine/threonine-protein phosphatase [Burkholderiales bacterium]MDE2503295.1 serine/threonine-protein phosphatase [Burkholderiales bacterium]